MPRETLVLGILTLLTPSVRRAQDPAPHTWMHMHTHTHISMHMCAHTHRAHGSPSAALATTGTTGIKSCLRR